MMKTLKKLSEKALTKATELTNEQMQAVTGGAPYTCVIGDPNNPEWTVYVDAISAEAAAYIVAIYYGASMVACR